MRSIVVAWVVLAGCTAGGDDRGGGGRDGGTPGRDTGSPTDVGPIPDRGPPPDAPVCGAPATPAGPEVQLAPPFAGLYTVYALGSVPGVPNPLGGIVAKAGDPNTLLVAGASETSAGAIYEIGVRRDSCGHILEFVGTARLVAMTPFVDANLVYGPDDLLVYTEWPQYTLSQLLPGATTPSRQTDLRPFGVSDFDDQGPGGVGFVPPGLAPAGTLRLVTWPAGRWYQVQATLSGGLYTIDALTETVTLPNNPGGFAYVPAGSPGFAAQSLIVAEWRRDDRDQDRVAVYEVDPSGDPMPTTRREFFSRFPRPWGAYFEPVTGDYLFLTWGDGDDRVYIVQGFVPPPELF